MISSGSSANNGPSATSTVSEEVVVMQEVLESLMHIGDCIKIYKIVYRCLLNWPCHWYNTTIKGHNATKCLFHVANIQAFN